MERQHAAAGGVEKDQHARRLEDRIQNSLHSRIGEIEGVKRQGHGLEAEQRESGEDQNRPGGGDRPAEAGRRGGVRIAINDPPGDPPQRNRRQRQESKDARKGQRLQGAHALPDAREPAAGQRLHHHPIDREFARDAHPELRTEEARRSGEGLARKQLPSDGADRVALSSTSSSMARAVRSLASSASCFAFSATSSAVAASVVCAGPWISA